MAYPYTLFPGEGPQNVPGLGVLDPSRLQTSQSGGSYIGGMTPSLPMQDMSFMWGGGGTSGTGMPAANGMGTPGSGQATGYSSGGGMTPGAWAALGGDPVNYGGPTNPMGPSSTSGGVAVDGPAGNMSMLGYYSQEPTTDATGNVTGYGGGAPWMPNVGGGGGVADESGMHGPTGGWSQSMLGGGAPADSTPGITSTPSYGGGGPNPYLGGMADDIQRRTQEMLGDSFAGINSQAVGSGGLGGTRQGVAQGIAGGKAADYMSGQLAGLFGNQYNQDANRGLQRYGMDQNYALGNQGQNQGFYTAQRGQDLQQLGLGASLYGLGQQGEWSPYSNYASLLSPWGRDNGTTTQSAQTGGGWQGLLGGLLGGAQMGWNNGWWGNKAVGT